MSATKTENIEAELKSFRDKRSHQQGILRGLLNKIEHFIRGNDYADVEHCEKTLKEIPIALAAYEVIHGEIVHVYKKYGVDITDITKKAELLRAEKIKRVSEATIWIKFKHEEEEKRELEESVNSCSDENNDTIKAAHFPLLSELSPIGRMSSTRVGMDTTDSRDSEITFLRSRLQQLDDQGDRNDRLEGQLRDMQEAMHQQQADHLKDEAYYKNSISSLQRDLQKAQTTSTPGGASNTTDTGNDASLSQQDMLQFTTMMGQANTSMFKQILDETHTQQKQFYTRVTGPKAELLTFDGDKTKYMTFMHRFDDLVGKTDRSFSSKLTTLMEHCGPQVKSFIDCCNYMDPQLGYMAARNTLKERYGNPYLISQAWLKKITEFGQLRTPELMTQFSAIVSSAATAMRSMGYESELANTRSLKEIYDRIPGYVQKKWLAISRERTQKGSNAHLQDMIDLITNAAYEMNDPVYGSGTVKSTEAKGDRSKPARRATTAVGDVRQQQPRQDYQSQGFQNRKPNPKDLPPCAMCQKGHATYRCFIYKDLSAQERLQFVDREKLCRRCITAGHTDEKCSRDWKCLMQDCGGEHHYSLHRALTRQDQANPATPRRAVVARGEVYEMEDTENGEDSNEQSYTRKSVKCVSKVVVKPCYMGLERMNPDYVLPAIPVYLFNDIGQMYQTYALIDTGSSCTMIKGSLFREMKLRPVAHTEIVLSGLNTDFELNADVVDFGIQGTNYADKEYMQSVVVNEDLELGDHQSSEMKRYKEWEHLKHLDLIHHDSNEIGLLIGQDQAFLIVQIDQIPGPNKYYPYGIKTRLGWTMFGHYTKRVGRLKLFHMLRRKVNVGETEQVDDRLERSLEKLWEIDQIPESVGFGPVNRNILRLWDKETKLVNGHFEVPIPFKQEPPCIPNNYMPVKSRLDSLTRRLLRDDSLKKAYVDAMVMNLERGFLEKAPSNPDQDYLHYNPHQPVLSDTRSTKCRVVGHLSFKYKEVSLNDLVHQGPNLGTPMIQVMIGFRLFRYVITGDIEKMFNQVRVPDYQRDALSILWYKDNEPGNEVEVLRGTTQMFGGTWCPAASVYAFKRSAKEFGHEYPPIVSEAIEKGFYVDDLLRSIQTVSIGIRLIKDLRHLLSRVGFNLIKFGSNSSEILESVPTEMRAKPYEAIEFALNDAIQDKTLGSWWRPKEDVFEYKIAEHDKPLTRRGLLSTYSSIFDPLGFVGPVVLLAKLIIQELCRKGLEWDEPIPEEYVKRWLCWKEELPVLQNFTVNRWLGVDTEKSEDYQLHVFADASENGYGCVIYLCALDEVGEIVRVSLVQSKSKVSPLKSMTIPRLELTAAVLAAKMENKMVQYLDVELLPSVFWIDSTVVLHYIKQQSRDYKTFVANRISVIQNLTDASQWRHVPSGMNIADVASRGCSPREFLEKTDWKEGPAFLRNISEWPATPQDIPDDIDVDKRDRPRKVVFVCLKNDDPDIKHKGLYRMLSGISQWNKKVRVLALLRRMVKKKCGKEHCVGPITTDEYRFCEELIVGLVQRVEITKSQIESRVFRKLYPFDKDGLFRVGGRLMLSELRFEEKHPIIFPKGEIAQSYIRYVHARLGHPGVDRTFYEVRKQYWLLGGRRYVKETLSGCVTCRKLKAKPMNQFMSSLPKVRIDPGKAPFEHVGIDYFGPIYVKIGRSLHKRWCCAMTCMKSRALHIEVAVDMTTSSFINALQRFISRRGRPVSITSDNGTNFVGANAEIKRVFADWNQGKINNYLVQQGIDWRFNTPGASHHGGVWERQIRTIRQLMMSLVKEQVLTDEALHTYMCLVEEIVNSRPLTKLSEDSDDTLPLTPNHLLLLRQTQGLTGNYDKLDTLKRRWRQLQYLADIFWKRWVNSYVKGLQERTKWLEKQPNVRVGDLVLMVKESTPQLSWPLAVVQQVFVGKDDVVRSVRIKTQDGVYERPISKLVTLECDR